MTIYIESECEVNFDFDYEKVAREVVSTAIDYVDFPFDAEVSITLTEDSGIQSINKEFRNIDSPTDVLSFPMIEYNEPCDFSSIEEKDDLFNPETGEVILGDIVLNIPRIYKQAEEYGHSNLREYAFLIAHSMLHLFGFDHMTDNDASIMEEKQRDILDILGITRN